MRIEISAIYGYLGNSENCWWIALPGEITFPLFQSWVSLIFPMLRDMSRYVVMCTLLLWQTIGERKAWNNQHQPLYRHPNKCKLPCREEDLDNPSRKRVYEFEDNDAQWKADLFLMPSLQKMPLIGIMLWERIGVILISLTHVINSCI